MTNFSFSQRAQDRRVPKATGFRCTSCSQHTTRVTDSRPTSDGLVRRRHSCAACNVRFTTLEVPAEWWEGHDHTALSIALRDTLTEAVKRFNLLHRAIKEVAKRDASN